MEFRLLSAMMVGFTLGCAGAPRAPAHKADPAAADVRTPKPFVAEAPSTPSPDAPDAASPEAPPVASAAEPAPAVSAPALPADTTVLHIGDSFAGALGIDLNREFDKVGVKGVLKYQTSSYIPTWAWSKELDTYLRRYKPDLVIVTLGANELEIEDPRDRIPTIRRLIERISGQPCLWIGPPLWEGARDELPPVIRENVAPCRYMDSTALLPPLERARDKIHPTMTARQQWARFVIDWLARQRDVSGKTPWSLRPTP